MHKLFVSAVIVGLWVLLVAAIVNSLGFGKSKHQVKEITLIGGIDPNYSYYVKVSYFTSLDTLVCSSYSLFGGRGRSFKELVYYPEIEYGEHMISFPVNEMSPDRGCKWVPRKIALCITVNGNPKEGGCGTLFDIGKSGSTQRGVPVYANSSSAERPIEIQCAEVTSDLGHWWCQHVPPPSEDSRSSSLYPGDMIIFPDLKENNFPMDTDDVYWLEITYLPADV